MNQDPVNMPCLQDEHEAQQSGDFEGLKAENDNPEPYATREDSYVQCPNCGYNVAIVLK